MDHESAIRSHTPERYILGELRPPERDEFEEHLADCPRCMMDLAAVDTFAANAAAVFADRRLTSGDRVPDAPKRRFGFFPAALVKPWGFPALAFSGAFNVALLAILGLGLLRTPAPPIRAGYSEVFTVHAAARGESEAFPVNGKSAFATFRFDLVRRYPRYSYTLDGVGSGEIAAPADAETLSLTIPVAGIPPGDHKLRISGWDGAAATEIASAVVRIAPGR